MPKKLRPFQRELQERSNDKARIERELKLRLGAVNLKLDRHKYISLDARFLECSVVGDLVELWPQMAMGKARKPL
jgi:hypothetical protein